MLRLEAFNPIAALPTPVTVGDFLIAEPFLDDPNFGHTVILVCEQTPDGTLGLILNRPTDTRIDELMLEGFPTFNSTLFLGGPVATDSLFFLHNLGDLVADSTPVARGVWWGGNFEEVRFLIQNELIKPYNIRFFLGYAGWESGQLDDEIAEGTWLVEPSDPNFVFRHNTRQLWAEVLRNKGNHYTVLGTMTRSPVWN